MQDILDNKLRKWINLTQNVGNKTVFGRKPFDFLALFHFSVRRIDLFQRYFVPLLCYDLEVLEDGVQIAVHGLFILVFNGNLGSVGLDFFFEFVGVVFGFWLFFWLLFELF